MAVSECARGERGTQPAETVGPEDGAARGAAEWRAALRAEARAGGVRWQDVQDRARELASLDAEQRETYEGVRALAWRLVCRASGWVGRDEFWRVGWTKCFPRIVRTGELDYTSVPRYDEVAAGVAELWPEWRGRDAGELFDELLAPYEPRRPRAEIWGEALDDVLGAIAAGGDAAARDQEGGAPCEF